MLVITGKPRLRRVPQLRSGYNPRSHVSEKRRPEISTIVDSGLCGSFRTFLTAGPIRKEKNVVQLCGELCKLEPRETTLMRIASPQHQSKA